MLNLKENQWNYFKQMKILMKMNHEFNNILQKQKKKKQEILMYLNYSKTNK